MSDVGLGYGAGDDGLFDKPSEDEAAAVRAAAIKPESELLQVGLEVDGCHRALVRAEDPPFQKAGDPMHAGHGDVGGVA